MGMGAVSFGISALVHRFSRSQGRRNSQTDHPKTTATFTGLKIGSNTYVSTINDAGEGNSEVLS